MEENELTACTSFFDKMYDKVDELFAKFRKSKYHNTSILIKRITFDSVGRDGMPIARESVDHKLWNNASLWTTMLINRMHRFNSLREPLTGHCLVRIGEVNSGANLFRLSVEMNFDNELMEQRIAMLLQDACTNVVKEPGSSLSMDDYAKRVLIFLSGSIVSQNDLPCSFLYSNVFHVDANDSFLFRIVMMGGCMPKPFTVLVTLKQEGDMLTFVKTSDPHFVKPEEVSNL